MGLMLSINFEFQRQSALRITANSPPQPQSNNRDQVNIKSWQKICLNYKLHSLLFNKKSANFYYTESSRLMRIALLRISLLRFFNKVHKFALCESMPYALCFISFVRFFDYFCPICLMQILANANFFQNQKSHQSNIFIDDTSFKTCEIAGL